MIIGRLTVMALMLMKTQIAPLNHVHPKPTWTVALYKPFLRDRGGFQGPPERNRSCGVARWDEAHILIYSLTSARRLGIRKPGEMTEGTWAFSIQIIRTGDGVVEQSVTIPAGGINSELAVVAGGIVESDRDHLLFYSRQFKRINQAFKYAPLHGPEEFFQEGTISDPEYLYVTNDQKTLLLIDSSGRRSHVFVFSGTDFKLRSDWLLEDVDWHDISIGDEGLLYRGFETPNHAYWTRFDGRTWEWNVALPVQRRCISPVYIDKDRVLNVCDPLTILGRDNSTLIYKGAKKERVQPPAVISPDKRLAAVFRYAFKGGGIWDTTEYRTNVNLLIARLDDEHKTCDIPVVPMPRSQLAFNFASDSTLIVLNDGNVAAYKLVCP